MEETNQVNSESTYQNQIIIKVPSREDLLKSKLLSPSTYVLIFILFFFTFCDVSCSRQLVASIKGIDFLFGKTISNSLFGTVDTLPINYWAVLAFCSCLFGLSLFIRKIKFHDYYLCVTSIIGFVSIILLQITIFAKVGKSGSNEINVSFQFAYWLVVFLYLGNVLLSYLRFKEGEAKKPSILQVYKHINENIYSKWSFLLLIGICFFILFNTLYLHSPSHLGKNIASKYNNCENDFNKSILKNYESFLTHFEGYRFSKQQQANTKLDSIFIACSYSKNEVSLKIDKQVADIKVKLKNNNEKYKAFQQAFSDNFKNGNSGEILEKIDQVKKILQDKISKINDPKPDIERIKMDLIGKQLSSWTFVNISEIQSVTIISSANLDKDLVVFFSTDLKDFRSGKIFFALIKIQYHYTEGQWIFNNITEVYYSAVPSVNYANGRMSIEGEWNWGRNTALYKHDGTWSGVWKDGSKHFGTFKIIENDISIYNENGSELTSGKLSLIGNDIINIQSFFNSSIAKRIK